MRANGIKQILGLCSIKNIQDLRDKVTRAKNNPTELVNLLCKDFNIRQTEQDKWLTYEIVNNEATFEMAELENCYAVGGVDLSSVSDLTCATLLVFKNNKKFVLQQYFIAKDRLEFKIKDDKIPYDKWEQRGLVTVCEGAKVDYTKVTEWFMRMRDDYGIYTTWVGYDPWNSNYWVDEMQKCNFKMLEIRQGAKTMSNPMKQLESDLIEKSVIYNNNPVLKWCLCNTAKKVDENENIRPVKRTQTKSQNRWSSKFNNSLLYIIRKNE